MVDYEFNFRSYYYTGLSRTASTMLRFFSRLIFEVRIDLLFFMMTTGCISNSRILKPHSLYEPCSTYGSATTDNIGYQYVQSEECITPQSVTFTNHNGTVKIRNCAGWLANDFRDPQKDLGSIFFLLTSKSGNKNYLWGRSVELLAEDASTTPSILVTILLHNFRYRP